MLFIDTHCHINQEEFNSSIAEIISSAKEVSVEKICVPNIDKSTIEDIKNICTTYPDILYPMMGVHPTSVKEDYKEELALVTKKLETGNYIAVGEIGIDLYWDKTFQEQQEDAFLYQLELADRLQLPVNIHVRNAFDEAFAVLKKKNKPLHQGIFHCFSGNIEQAQSAIEMGFLLGIGGVITFKNGGLDKVVKELPLEKLVLETDAPWLAPTPHRGKLNQPAYLPLIARKLADIYEVSLEKIAAITTYNAKELYNI